MMKGPPAGTPAAFFVEPRVAGRARTVLMPPRVPWKTSFMFRPARRRRPDVFRFRFYREFPMNRIAGLVLGLSLLSSPILTKAALAQEASAPPQLSAAVDTAKTLADG